MSNEIIVIKRYLESKHLHVSEYWIECFVEWFKSQYENYTQKTVCEKAYEQWLLLDLRDTKVRSFPPNLSNEKKHTLTGNYVVQVMYVKDISKSSLSQLRRIRNMFKLTRPSTDGEEDEPQGKRMLSLHVTDGIEYIHAFEYQTISCLKLNMTPGIKIHLVGPLNIRNGEILLKENNVRVLGGEVEELLVCNAVENVLARELNLPENPDPNVNQEHLEVQARENTQFGNNINYVSQNTNNIRQQNTVPVYNPKPSSSSYEHSENKQKVNLTIDDDDMILADISLIEEEKVLQETKNHNELIFEDDFTNEDLDIDEIENQIKEMEEIQHINEVNLKQNTFPIIVPKEPHIYIKQILDNRDKITNDKFRVKAQFVQVIERLAVSSSKGWTMTFKITDGTAVLAVDFSNQVLSDLVGLSVEEALHLKQKIKNKHSESTELMKEALNGCKQKLTLLNCFMDLQFKDGVEMPTVVLLKPVDNKDLPLLKLRVEKI